MSNTAQITGINLYFCTKKGISQKVACLSMVWSVALRNLRKQIVQFEDESKN